MYVFQASVGLFVLIVLLAMLILLLLSLGLLVRRGELLFLLLIFVDRLSPCRPSPPWSRMAGFRTPMR